MAQDWKLTRRIMGMLSTRLREVPLESVTDPRGERGRRWQLPTLLHGVLLGLMAGCKSLAEVETLTADLSPVVRRRLKIGRRIADTTMRDVLTEIDPQEIGQLIARTASLAERRKALLPVGLPLDVVSMDGKATAVEDLDRKYAQTHHDRDGFGACGLVRTITCTLVSCAARALLEVVPMGAKGNEVGFFETAYRQLLKNHPKRFDVVTYDAGAYSAANAKLVVDSGKHYLFGLKDKRKFMRQKAEQVLGNSTVPEATSEDVLCKKNNVRVVRRLFMAKAPRGYKSIKSVRTIFRVQSQKIDGTGKVLEGEDRYFISSMLHTKLAFPEWLELARRHWAVETSHNILDVSFEEDARPWITHHAQGMLVVLLLRRLAYNLLTLFRSVTQRSEEKKLTPWKTLFRWVAKALEQATEAQLKGLRVREGTAAFD